MSNITSQIEARDTLNAADDMRTEADRLTDRRECVTKMLADHPVLTQDQRKCIDDVLANLEQAIEILGQLAGKSEDDFASYEERRDGGIDADRRYSVDQLYAGAI